MANGHRSRIKRERNELKDTRPSATLSYARVPVQKACFVLDAIRGKDINTAIGIVTYDPRYASSILEKLLKSAVANAANNNNMNPDDLYVAECYANRGPSLKRIQPRAQGRAYRILKRMSHITVVLDDIANKGKKTELKVPTRIAHSVEPVEEVSEAQKEVAQVEEKPKRTRRTTKKAEDGETPAKKTTTRKTATKKVDKKEAADGAES